MPSPISASLSEGQDNDYSIVHAVARAKPADRAQRRFSQLVKKIELQREQLKHWQDYSTRYNQRIASELAPLEARLRAGRREMAVLLDTLLTQPIKGALLSRAHRGRLRRMLVHLLDDLLQEDADPGLEVLRDKYRQPEDRGAPFEMDAAQEFLKAVLDLDIDEDHGASSVEELMEHARLKMQERHEADARRRTGARGEARHENDSPGGPDTRAAEAHREQAAREVGQSLRDVFRKLVSALHPDREPDAVQRQRKNELMQRVNRAYEANDLLTLLGLQLQIEQIDAAHLSAIPPQRLGHYIQILSEQLAELELEVERCRHPFRSMLPFGGKRQLTVNDVERQLNEHLVQMRNAARELEDDLTSFRDPYRLRERLRATEWEEDFDPFGELEDLDGMMDAPQPGRRRRRRRR